MGFADKAIYDYVDENKSIILRADVLTPDWTPPKPIGRLDQIEEVAALSNNLFLCGTPKNSLVFGLTGTGKTTIIKYALESLIAKIADMVAERDVLKAKKVSEGLTEAEATKLEELNRKISTSKVQWVYVLCKKHKTQAAILHKLITTLDPHTNYKRTGVATDTYYDELYKLQRQQNVSLIVVLDEIDYILQNEQTDDILYNFTRAIANAELDGQFIRIWGLSNSIKFESKLDDRIISAASFKKLNFPTYNTNELFHILKNRVELGLIPDSIIDDVLLKCASNACDNGGDARKALYILSLAAEMTDKAGRKTIELDMIRDAEDVVMQSEVVKSVLELKRKHKLVLLSILRILRYRKSATTGMVTKVFNLMVMKHNELNPDSKIDNRDRYFTKRAIDTLNMMELVTTDIVSQGRGKGRTTYVYVEELDIPVILKCIYDDYILCELEGFDPIEGHQGIIFEESTRKKSTAKQQKFSETM